MVATWLTELYLDQINRALLDTHAGVGNAEASSVEQLEQQLQVNIGLLAPTRHPMPQLPVHKYLLMYLYSKDCTERSKQASHRPADCVQVWT
jgi:hypothetical protein